jgi:ABC-2 type transport system permease protein
MTLTLLSVTLRSLLNRRRTFLLAFVGGLLVLIAALYRLSDPATAEAADVTQRLLADFGIGVLLPLVAVIVGTAALGSELDDGTIVYLLAKPIPRWRIALAKLVVAWVVTVLLVAPAIVIGGIVGNGDARMAVGFGLAATLGALEYVAIFVALSLVTSRALIVGLAYVVVWEGVVAGLFTATRTISVRQHALALAEAAGGSGARGVAELGLGFALAVAAILTLLAAVLAVRRLEEVELRGETG